MEYPMTSKEKKFPGFKKLLLSLKKSSAAKDDKQMKKRQVAPNGCFAVYVGPEKQRFVIKTEYANHPLFKMLLEDAESEYGFNNEGPIKLPCDVDFFYRVLAEMDRGRDDDYENIGCNRNFVYGSCNPFTSTRRWRNYDGCGIIWPSDSITLAEKKSLLNVIRID